MSASIRSAVVEPFPGVSVLPFRSIIKSRNALTAGIEVNSNGCTTVDPRTAEKRIRTFLAGKGIHLKKISARMRCYVVGESFETAISSVMHEKYCVLIKTISEREKQRLLDEVARSFADRKQEYWVGNWRLDEEISNIPQTL